MTFSVDDCLLYHLGLAGLPDGRKGYMLSLVRPRLERAVEARILHARSSNFVLAPPVPVARVSVSLGGRLPDLDEHHRLLFGRRDEGTRNDGVIAERARLVRWIEQPMVLGHLEER